MNTKLENMKVAPEFQDLFDFENKEAELQHRAEMISFRILSEVERLCEERKIKKKELAEMVGTSGSYITQLFRGDKQVNTQIMAKFEDALHMLFEIKFLLDGQDQVDLLAKQLTKDKVAKYRWNSNGYTCFLFSKSEETPNKTIQLVAQMKNEENNTLKQVG